VKGEVLTSSYLSLSDMQHANNNALYFSNTNVIKTAISSKLCKLVQCYCVLSILARTPHNLNNLCKPSRQCSHYCCSQPLSALWQYRLLCHRFTTAQRHRHPIRQHFYPSAVSAAAPSQAIRTTQLTQLSARLQDGN
jgi:hypothetical protein